MRKISLLKFVIGGGLLAGCSMIQSGKVDVGTAVSAGGDLFKAASLSDEEVKNMANQAVSQSDKSNKVLAGGKYASRLNKVVAKLKNYDGQKFDFKVYQSSEVNAFAMANGSVRVYSGLMDRMNDDELLFIMGHEIGHVKQGHSKEKVRLAYGASAARKGVASSNSIGGAVAASEIGAFTEELINAQFSQSEETESDEYGLKILKEMKRPVKAGPTALRKLASLGGDHGFLSSHPDPEDRAAHLESIK